MASYSAPIESLREFAETLRDATRSGISRYRQIFQEERVVRAIDLLAFWVIHTFVFVPVVCHWFEVKLPSDLVVSALGIAWAALTYPLSYLEAGKSGLLNLSVEDYLKTRATALVGAWMLLVFVPIFALYSLRWVVIPVVVLRLLWAFLAK